MPLEKVLLSVGNVISGLRFEKLQSLKSYNEYTCHLTDMHAMSAPV